MPVSFQPPGLTNDHPDSLRGDTLSTPLFAHESFDDIPFKPQDDDHVSLSMKKSRRHPHERHDTIPCPKAGAARPETRRRPTQVPRQRQRSHNLRKTLSLPTVQPRFDHGSVETLEAQESLQTRARRWTVPSKGASTCGLATLVRVDDTANKAESDPAATSHTNQSPAMITLRRATTVRSRRQTTTLTSFPPPKFSRDSNGLLSSFLSSVTGYAETPVSLFRESKSRESSMQTRRISAISTKDNLHTSTSAVAPPVQTEVSAVEPQLTISGPNQAGSSMRRCSTRYITENTVFEIIWDEDWSSSTGSEGGDRSPPGRGSILQSRELAGMETLERRLSNALSRSRRASVQESQSRKASYVPGTETTLQSIWTNPKIARLFREPASNKLPRANALKRTNLLLPGPTEPGFEHAVNGDDCKQGASPSHVEFFPPLRSRANTNGNKSPGKASSRVAQNVGPTHDRHEQNATRPAQEDSRCGAAGTRFGGMLGISTHEKRRSISDQHGQRRRSRRFGGRRASEGERRGKAFDDETMPLLEGN